jgi:hypothetical protein
MDGTNWTRRLSNTTSDLYDLAYNDGIWVAVGNAGKIITSSTASTFNLRYSGTELAIFGITFGGGQFVAVGKDGLVLSSPNGTEWSVTGTEQAQDLTSVAYGNGRFVAVGTNGIVQVSTNSTDWQPITTPAVTGFRRVAFGNGYFVAIPAAATNNTIFASKEGLSWTPCQVSEAKPVGVDFSDGELWLTGENSTIWRTSLGHAFAPTLNAGKNDNGFVLTVRPAASGNYQIEAASSISPANWSLLTTLTNIDVLTTWTDTNIPKGAKFYRAIRQ